MKKWLAYGVAMLMVGSLTACAQAKQTGMEKKTETAAETQTQYQESKESSAVSDTRVLPPDGYPKKNIEFVVPAAAGATMDLLVRGLNESGLDLGKPLAISNMAGASQTLGLAEVASREGDGYTLTCSGAAGTLVQPLLLNLTYSMDDFRYISMLNAPIPNAVAVSASSDIKSWDDLLEKLKAGEELHYTSANTGSVGHMAALQLMNQIGATSASYVSYNGSAEATTALLSGDVDFMINDVDLVMDREKEGQFQCLLTLDKERSSIAPDVPAAGEYGIEGMENFMGMTWIMVKADTPDDIVNYIKQQLDQAVESEEFAEFLKTMNKMPTPVVTEKELTDMLYKARDAYKDVVKMMN